MEKEKAKGNGSILECLGSRFLCIYMYYILIYNLPGFTKDLSWLVGTTKKKKKLLKSSFAIPKATRIKQMFSSDKRLSCHLELSHGLCCVCGPRGSHVQQLRSLPSLGPRHTTFTAVVSHLKMGTVLPACRGIIKDRVVVHGDPGKFVKCHKIVPHLIFYLPVFLLPCDQNYHQCNDSLRS